MQRTYRKWVDNDLVSFDVKVDETDLMILADKDFSKETEASLSKVFSLTGVDQKFIKQVLNKVKNTPEQKWQNYAEDAWFKDMEERCEAVLDEYYFSRNALIK